MPRSPFWQRAPLFSVENGEGSSGSSPSPTSWSPPPSYSRLPQKPSPQSRLGTLAFYGIAAVFGLCCQTIFFSDIGPGPGRGYLSDRFGYRPPPPPPPPPHHPPTLESPSFELNNPEPCSSPPQSSSVPFSKPYIRPGIGNYVVPQEEAYNEDQLRAMIATTKGYYARDYSLWLGWNNVGSFSRDDALD